MNEKMKQLIEKWRSKAWADVNANRAGVFHECANELEVTAKESPWISIFKTPDAQGDYLIRFRSGECEVGYWDGSLWEFDRDSIATHWMPIPPL